MNRQPFKFLSRALVALALAIPTEAHADHETNRTGRDYAAATLGIAGSAAAGFDIACVVYLAGGRDKQTGRIIVGLGSLLSAGALFVGSWFALNQLTDSFMPAADGKEEKALPVGRALAGVDIALGAISLGLGIAALATYGSADGVEQTSPRWWVHPYAITADGDAGGGLRIAGEF